MYCPKCLSNTLFLKEQGTVRIHINKLGRDSSLFFFDLNKENRSDIERKIDDKIDELCKWYSGFKNIEEIHNTAIFSSDFACSNGCVYATVQRLSVIGLLITQNVFIDLIKKNAQKYNIPVSIRLEIIE